MNFILQGFIVKIFLVINCNGPLLLSIIRELKSKKDEEESIFTCPTPAKYIPVIHTAGDSRQ